MSDYSDQALLTEESKPQHTALLIGLVIAAIFLSLRLCYLFLADAQRFPIQKVKITASYQHLSHKELESVLSGYLKASFFSLSASKLQQSLKQLDWVDDVSLSRVWPDTLTIKISEKKPIAIFDQAMVTADGRLFNQGVRESDFNLPKLNGPKEQLTEVLQVYQKLSKILAEHGLYMASLELRDNQAWDLTLVNGIKIQLGKKEIERRLRRLCKAYPSIIAEKAEQIASVDLRYSHGMAVQWKQ